jgi:microcompartment protein CcmL/EutN
VDKIMGALGFIEVSGYTTAIEAVDVMLKTADVKFVTWEKKLGGRLVTVIVTGEVSAVNEAIEHGILRANKVGKTVAHAVIANPHQEIFKMLQISAARTALQGSGGISGF